MKGTDPATILTPEIHVGPAEEQAAMRAEAAIRADQTRRIVEALRALRLPRRGLNVGNEAADAIAREFDTGTSREQGS